MTTRETKDAGAHLSPPELYQLYRRGFKDGAGAVAYRHQNYRAYMRGYEDGAKAASAAGSVFAKEVGYDPSKSILRSAT